MRLLELFDQVYPWTKRVVQAPGSEYPTWVSTFASADGRQFDVIHGYDPDGTVELTLLDASNDDSVDVTGLGDAYRVFGTLLAINDEYAHEVQPETITFSALDPSHTKLYKRMFARRTPAGYRLAVTDLGSETEFVMDRNAQ